MYIRVLAFQLHFFYVHTMYILRTLYVHYKYISVAFNVRSSYISVAFFLMYLKCTLEVQYSCLIQNSSQIFDLKFVYNFNVDPKRSTIQNPSQILTSILYSNWKFFPIQNLVYYNVHFTYIVSTFQSHLMYDRVTFQLHFF